MTDDRHSRNPGLSVTFGEQGDGASRILKPTLDGLYDSFNMPDSATDPIQLVRRFSARTTTARSWRSARRPGVRPRDERPAVHSAPVDVMGDGPAAFVRRFEPERDGAALRPFVHRWTRGADIIALLWVLHQMLERSGSLESFFLEGDDGRRRRTRGARQLLDAGRWRSTCKRAYGRVPARPGVATSSRAPRPAAAVSA